MADEQIASTEIKWQRVSRSAHRPAHFSPLIRVRRNGQLALTADFVRMANIGEFSHATVFTDEGCRRLALEFHSNETERDCFRLARDGSGSRECDNRVLNLRSLFAQVPALAAMLKEDVLARQFQPSKISGNRWQIVLTPCFECVWGHNDEVHSSASGIYRYRRGAETIYIGRGKIRERVRSSERSDWDFDLIQYSILNDDIAERRWEAFWLEDYRRQNNRWPLHNRIAGIAAKSQAG